MANQTIVKPKGLIKDLKKIVHGICMVTFIVIQNNLLDSNYFMLNHPWLKDVKISHDWGSNTIIIKGINMSKTISITKNLRIYIMRFEVLVCYDFHYGIFDEEKDLMFAP
jgi:hypothetical protein